MSDGGVGSGAMSGRARLEAAFRGEAVDRVPIWLREGFPVLEGPANEDDYQRGWQADTLYRELFDDIAPHADTMEGWSIPGMNRMLLVPPEVIETTRETISPDLERVRTTIHTPRGDLAGANELQRNVVTAWRTQYPVESIVDLKKLAEVPFTFDDRQIDSAVKSYKQTTERVGDRGVSQLGLSSPMVCISGAMPLQLFLELSMTERDLLHELCEEVTRRIIYILDRLFARDISFRTTANLGGSEQCTPPMMRPEGFDEYVVPYDGRIIDRLHRENIPVKVHCHGKIRHALKRMVEMGVDATDPVEPPPAGDLTYAEAREIADGKITLVGNLELDELTYSEPGHIRNRVKEILSHGTDRLILGTSAGPLTFISPRLAENYRVFVETALEYGS